MAVAAKAVAMRVVLMAETAEAAVPKAAAVMAQVRRAVWTVTQR